MSAKTLGLAALFGAALMAAPVAASTLSEADVAGGFSNSWTAPTVVAGGTTEVSGSGAADWMGGDRFDIFHFSGMTPGATSVTFDFSLTGLQ